MTAVIDKKLKAEKKDGRAAIKNKNNADNKYTKELEARVTLKTVADESTRLSVIIDMMVKGRQEIQKQRLYKSRLNNIEFAIKYEGNRINGIKE